MIEDSNIQVVRENSVAVSWQTKNGLGYVSKALGYNCTDQLADEVLADWLKTNHPEVVAHMKTRHEADKAFRDGLKAKIGTKPPF